MKLVNYFSFLKELALNPEKSLRIHFSLILVYTSYCSIYYLNHHADFEILFTLSGIKLFCFILGFQFLATLLLNTFQSNKTKAGYLFIVFSSFLLLNLAGFLVYATEFLNKYLTFYLRIRDLLIAFLLVLAFLSFILKSKFDNTIRIFNTFLAVLIIGNIGRVTISGRIVTEKGPLRDNENETTRIPYSDDGVNKYAKQNILLILLDEYSSWDELENYQESNEEPNDLRNFLDSAGFTVKTSHTLKNSTINSLNMIFNRNSNLSFRDESHENASKELKESAVINSLHEKGYKFKNFSFFNIGNHESFYSWQGPYSYNEFELLLSLSIYPMVLSSLKEDSASNAGYNREVEKQSLEYLKNLGPNENIFVYVHFLFPHGPFYLENEFSYLERNLDNYITFWNFCNKKIVNYLKSVPDLNTYKIIITGDHGFRSDRRIDPSYTITAFYNFDNDEIERISTVQDIGSLLLSQ